MERSRALRTVPHCSEESTDLSLTSWRSGHRNAWCEVLPTPLCGLLLYPIPFNEGESGDAEALPPVGFPVPSIVKKPWCSEHCYIPKLCNCNLCSYSMLPYIQGHAGFTSSTASTSQMSVYSLARSWLLSGTCASVFSPQSLTSLLQ